MGRSRATAKAAGSRFERIIADHFAEVIDDRIDRRVKTGAKDKGDIANVRTSDGRRVVIECKDVVTLNLSGWVGEAEEERVNDGADIAVVVHKRRGVGDPGQQYVTMTVKNFVALVVPAGVASSPASE